MPRPERPNLFRDLDAQTDDATRPETERSALFNSIYEAGEVSAGLTRGVPSKRLLRDGDALGFSRRRYQPGRVPRVHATDPRVADRELADEGEVSLTTKGEL